MNVFSLWNSLAGYVLSDAVAIWCINVLLQATLLAAIALTLAACFRRSPAVRYGVLCCGLLLTMLSPVSVYCLQTAGVGLLTVSFDMKTDSPTGDNPNAQTAELFPAGNLQEPSVRAAWATAQSKRALNAPPSDRQTVNGPTGVAGTQHAALHGGVARREMRRWLLK